MKWKPGEKPGCHDDPGEDVVTLVTPDDSKSVSEGQTRVADKIEGRAPNAVMCGRMGCRSDGPLFQVDVPDSGEIVACLDCAELEIDERCDQDAAEDHGDQDDQATDPGNRESPAAGEAARNLEVGGSGGQGVFERPRSGPLAAGKGRSPGGDRRRDGSPRSAAQRGEQDPGGGAVAERSTVSCTLRRQPMKTPTPSCESGGEGEAAETAETAGNWSQFQSINRGEGENRGKLTDDLPPRYPPTVPYKEVNR